ncbi:MAG: GTPase [Alphaproteobacteria bacterium]|nr:GTPase [Alphaproteobacteria bacterium]
MRLKTFYAKTMTEAMQMVRDTLGEDAIIVATREEPNSKAVRVTAAVDPAFEVSTNGAQTNSWLQYDDEEQEDHDLAEVIEDTLLRHNVADEVSEQIISCATVIGYPRAEQALIGALEHLYVFRPFNLKTQKKPILFVGPSGAGKTLAVAKMATRATLQNVPVKVITADTQRAGGTEQLAAFTRILKCPLQQAETLDTISFDDGYLTLIDTAGINPFDQEALKPLARIISKGTVDAVCVMPAGLDASESYDIARIFMALGVRMLMPTRLDTSRRLGGLLGAASSGLIFADAAHSPDVADGLTALNAQILTRYLMPPTDRTASSSHTTTTSRKKAG